MKPIFKPNRLPFLILLKRHFLFVPILFLLSGCSSSTGGSPDFNNPGSVPANPYTDAYDQKYHQNSPSDGDYAHYYSDPDSFPPSRFDR